MIKDFTCLIGFTLLFSSISMSINIDSYIFIKLHNLLDYKQNIIYEKIIKERLMIYFVGMFLGLGLGIFYYLKNPKVDYRICKFLAIIYLTKLGFYYIYPKSPLMLYSLKNKMQVDAWADIYTIMKYNWIKSLIIGFIGYLLLSYSYC